MDQVDRVAFRVSIAAGSGLILGAAVATYRGHPIARTMLSVAGTCALSGTACFGSERITHFILQSSISEEKLDYRTRLYTSHALGGVMGGGIIGGLSLGKPIPGMLLFTPIMLGIAFAELKAEEYREERLRELISKANETGFDVASDVTSHDRTENERRD